jgi:hypothetical protein
LKHGVTDFAETASATTVGLEQCGIGFEYNKLRNRLPPNAIVNWIYQTPVQAKFAGFD